MTGVVDLDELLRTMRPELADGDYVFCTVAADFDHTELGPLATFREQEGLTLVLAKEAAERADLAFETTYRQITLTVHSSLQAVGLTAAVASKLTEHNISANVIAAYFHDHIFVQTERAQAAMAALGELMT